MRQCTVVARMLDLQRTGQGSDSGRDHFIWQ